MPFMSKNQNFFLWHKHANLNKILRLLVAISLTNLTFFLIIIEFIF